jgi:hypothetical protein
VAEPEDNLAAESERPEWLPEKFESPEALAQSYTNLEREFTQTREHVKAMEENYQLLAQQISEQQQPPTPQYDPADVQAQTYAMYEQDPVGTMALIAQNAAAQALQQAQQQQQPTAQQAQQAQAALVAQYATTELRSRYDDFETERERVSQVISSNPRFQNDNIWADPATATAALDEAYKLVKADDFLSGRTPAPPAYDPAQAKRAAQSATGGNPRPDSPDEAQAAWEKIKNVSVGSYADLMGR